MTEIENIPNFMNSNPSKPAVIKFYGDSCAPCKMMIPIYEKAESIYKDKVTFYTANVKNIPAEVLDIIGITTVPTILYIGQAESTIPRRGAMALATLCSHIETFCL